MQPEGERHGAVFAVMVQAFWLIRVSRYNVNSEQLISHGILNFIESRCAVALHENQYIVSKAGTVCKNRDEFMYFIVRVMLRRFFIVKVYYNRI